MDIQELRADIDRIDEQMVKLFAQRMNDAFEIAKVKRENKLSVLDRTRERQVLCRVAELAGEDLERYAKVLFTTIMDVSRSYQRGLLGAGGALYEEIQTALANAPEAFPTKATVACQGVEGAYSQKACDRMFQFPSILYFSSFEGVFQAVEKGMCRYGVLPIENSAAGSIGEVYNLMEKHRFHIVRGIRQRVDHVLLANPGASLRSITEITSHPQGIAQCSAFLSAHPNIQVVPAPNTATAAKNVAESGRMDTAAIASRDCAEIYGLKIISEAVADTDNNYTRFIVIGKSLEIFPGANKLSMSFNLPHQPGALNGMISRFSSLDLNLTKLESRPIPGRDFEFRFHFDVEASLLSDEVARLVCEIGECSENFVLLGNYQEGI